MDLKFSEMTVDTILAQKYLYKNIALLELCYDYEGITTKLSPYTYDGKTFISVHPLPLGETEQVHRNTLQKMVSNLKQNVTLIAQLEYLLRNIPIEVTNIQVNLLIQYLKCYEKSGIQTSNDVFPDDSLLTLGRLIQECKHIRCFEAKTTAICHLFVTLFNDAGYKNVCTYFEQRRDSSQLPDAFPKINIIKGLDSGTVAVVSHDADVDSAVDKFISVSTKAPWRLRKILVQESVYQQFKDTLSWKCNLNKNNEPLTSDVLCSDTLTYNDKIFLMDPVELTEENPSVVTVEAYRTTKEVISLLQQDKTRYLSLWTNGIAEMNEVTHSTKSPVVWVNNVADFRGPAQVAEAVFSYTYSHTFHSIAKSDRFAKLCELSQSWLKLDLESRRDILCGVLDKYISLYPTNKDYLEVRNSILTCTLKSFVDVGKDYVCIGISQPVGILGYTGDTIFSTECLKSILQGNALYVFKVKEDSSEYTLLEQAGVPVLHGALSNVGNAQIIAWDSCFDSVTRAVWTNSGTIFAN